MELEPFSPYAWHDNIVHGMHVALGDHEAGDWRSDLVFDIDHIVNWSCAAEARPIFEVAPATLTFHDAGDLRLSIDCGNTGGQVALHAWSIDCITRERVTDQKVCLDRPYFRWRIELNWPKGGAIEFAASGFTQALRASPVSSEVVQLPAKLRLFPPVGS
jgi:hypothetical protein